MTPRWAMLRLGRCSRYASFCLDPMTDSYRTTIVSSKRMSAVRRDNTEPEQLVRGMIDGLGLHFTTNVGGLPGRPDLVLPSERVAIFVHGCFWHRHQNCPRSTTPRKNIDLWIRKFDRTIVRDADVVARLETAGWRALIVWECEIRHSTASSKIRRFLDMGFVDGIASRETAQPFLDTDSANFLASPSESVNRSRGDIFCD